MGRGALKARLLGRACVLVGMLLALDLAIRASFVHVGQPFELGAYLLSAVVSIGVASVALGLHRLVLAHAPRLASLVAFPFAAAYASLAVLGAYCHRYFHRYPTEHHAAFVLDDPYLLLDYVATYGSVPVFVAIAAVTLIFQLALVGGRPAPLDRFDGASLGAAVLLAVPAFFVLAAKEDEPLMLLDAGVSVATHRALSRPPGPTSFRALTRRTRPPPRATPPTAHPRGDILVIVNESWGRDHVLDAAEPLAGMPRLAQRLRSDSGDYVLLARAFANSTATDVSVPSLLTGVGPEEPAEKLHQMPLLSNLGRAAGYTTLMFSSQRLRWGHIRTFIEGGEFHEIIDAEQSGQPIVNDSGIDDLHAARELAAWIGRRAADERLLIVYGTNALHVPYQVNSPLLDEEDSTARVSRGSRYQKALRIMDLAIDRVLSELDAAGRLRNALVIITGDHGEAPGSTRSLPRGTNFYDSLIGVPMLLKLPATLGARERAALARNAGVNVQNIDIAPTVAHYTGHCFGAAQDRFCDAYSGRSLLLPVPPDRTLVALSTNDVRRWDNDGFALVMGDHRVVFSTIEGLGLFNAASDPDQTRDLWAHADPELRARVSHVIATTHHLARIVRKHASR